MLGAHTGGNEKCRCLADYVGRVPRSEFVDRVFPRPQYYRLLRSIRSFLVQRHAARKAQHYLGTVCVVSLQVAGILVHRSSEGRFSDRSRPKPEMNRIHCDICSAHRPLRVGTATRPRLRHCNRRWESG